MGTCLLLLLVVVVVVVVMALDVVVVAVLCYHMHYTKQNSDCLQLQAPQAE